MINIGKKFKEHISLCQDIGDLLNRGKDACDAGLDPDPSIAPKINGLIVQAKRMAHKIGEELSGGEAEIPRLVKSDREFAMVVQAYIQYAKTLADDDYDKILDALVESQEAKRKVTIVGKMMRFK